MVYFESKSLFLNECISPALFITFYRPQAALFLDVSASFWFFLLIINKELGSEKRFQNEVYRQIKSTLMNTFGSGESSPFDRVEFFIYYFLSSLSKFKLYFDSTQTFATEATFNLIRLMFALFFACQIYAHAR